MATAARSMATDVAAAQWPCPIIANFPSVVAGEEAIALCGALCRAEYPFWVHGSQCARMLGLDGAAFDRVIRQVAVMQDLQLRPQAWHEVVRDSSREHYYAFRGEDGTGGPKYTALLQHNAMAELPALDLSVDSAGIADVLHAWGRLARNLWVKAVKDETYNALGALCDTAPRREDIIELQCCSRAPLCVAQTASGDAALTANCLAGAAVGCTAEQLRGALGAETRDARVLNVMLAEMLNATLESGGAPENAALLAGSTLAALHSANVKLVPASRFVQASKKRGQRHDLHSGGLVTLMQLLGGKSREQKTLVRAIVQELREELYSHLAETPFALLASTSLIQYARATMAFHGALGDQAAISAADSGVQGASDDAVIGAAGAIALRNSHDGRAYSLGGQDILRHLAITCGISERQLQIAGVHFWVYFFRRPPPMDVLCVRSTHRYHLERLHLIDVRAKAQRIDKAVHAAAVKGYPAVVSVTADDSGKFKTAFILYPGLDGKPVMETLCFIGTTGKSGKAGAAMLKEALQVLGVDCTKVGHACGDGAGQLELKLVQGDRTVLVPGEDSEEETLVPSRQSTSHDGLHAVQLPFKAMAAGMWGKGTAKPDHYHIDQFLYQAAYMQQNQPELFNHVLRQLIGDNEAATAAALDENGDEEATSVDATVALGTDSEEDSSDDETGGVNDTVAVLINIPLRSRRTTNRQRIPTPQPTRWGHSMTCAYYFLESLGLAQGTSTTAVQQFNKRIGQLKNEAQQGDPLPAGSYLFPTIFEQMVRRTGSWRRKTYLRLLSFCKDVRMIWALQLLSDMGRALAWEVQQRCYSNGLFPSDRQGCQGIELQCRLLELDVPFAKQLATEPMAAVFPKSYAVLECMSAEDRADTEQLFEIGKRDFLVNFHKTFGKMLRVPHTLAALVHPTLCSRAASALCYVLGELGGTGRAAGDEQWVEIFEQEDTATLRLYCADHGLWRNGLFEQLRAVIANPFRTMLELREKHPLLWDYVIYMWRCRPTQNLSCEISFSRKGELESYCQSTLSLAMQMTCAQDILYHELKRRRELHAEMLAKSREKKRKRKAGNNAAAAAVDEDDATPLPTSVADGRVTRGRGGIEETHATLEMLSEQLVASAQKYDKADSTGVTSATVLRTQANRSKAAAVVGAAQSAGAVVRYSAAGDAAMAAAAATHIAEHGGRLAHTATVLAAVEASDGLRSAEGEKLEVIRLLCDTDRWSKCGQGKAFRSVKVMKAEVAHVFDATCVGTTKASTLPLVVARLKKLTTAARRRNGTSLADALNWEGSDTQRSLRLSLAPKMPDDFFARLCGMRD